MPRAQQISRATRPRVWRKPTIAQRSARGVTTRNLAASAAKRSTPRESRKRSLSWKEEGRGRNGNGGVQGEADGCGCEGAARGISGEDGGDLRNLAQDAVGAKWEHFFHSALSLLTWLSSERKGGEAYLGN
ncbi:hypothetical protein BHM03_00018026 [Ensete ventricosum]|nr:hypothetical protein BHM03_00018026 [Ensete ventricosum]